MTTEAQPESQTGPAPEGRPRVVMAVEATLDGRISLGPGGLLLDPAVGKRWEALRGPSWRELSEARRATLEALYRPRAVLEGSGSLVREGDAAAALPPAADDPAALGEDYLPAEVQERPGHEGWFVVVDSRGRVRWTIKRAGGRDLLVLVARQTPAAYLAYLRRETIPYLVVGEQRVDLGRALRALRARLDVACVLSEAGGTLNGALLRAGLVDEVNVSVLPALVGGQGTPALYGGAAPGPDDAPTRLRLLSVQAQTDGNVWLRYEVLRDAPPAT